MSFTYGGRLRDREIRLVNVVDGDKGPIHIQLAVHQLDDVEFEALSYVWGDPSNKLEILCNRQPFGVTENLHFALLERRRRGLTSLLWVDALCINQSDIDERTQQVRMMRAIYNSAKTVIVWLGQDGPHDKEGIELVERVYRECGGLSFDIDSVREGVRVDDFDYIDRGFPTPFRHPSTAQDPGWKSGFELLENSWFTRVWVVQELLVANQSVIWRGRLDLDPMAILFAAMLVDTKRDLWLDFNRHAAGSCHTINIARLFFQYRKKGPQPFWDTLCLCRNLQASDLRDRYFALVGISSGLEYELVDYNKTLPEVHAQVGCLCLRGLPERGLPSSGLDLLAFGHYRDHTSSTFGAVSWVPGLISADRFAVSIAEAYPTATLCHTKRGYAAARHMEDFGFLFDVEQRHASPTAYPVPFGLKVMGSRIDGIKSIARPNPSIARAFDIEAGLIQIDNVFNSHRLLRLQTEQSAEQIIWMLELRRLAHQSSDEDFWRALIYNRDGRLRPARRSLGESFACWWLKLALQIDGYLTANTPWIYVYQLSEASTPFKDAWSNFSNQRAFFVSENARIGWVPYTARPGDQLFVLKGMRVPVVIRPRSDTGWWQMVGACYIHGLMDAEAEDMAQDQWQWLKIR